MSTDGKQDNLIFLSGQEDTASEVIKDQIKDKAPEKAVIFAADCGEYDMEKSLKELEELCFANAMQPVAQVVQNRQTPDGATYLGEGRLAEGKMLCINLEAECAIFDAELTGGQIRNIEDILEVPVLDRTMLILEIFSKRATTGEGKLQTELATLQYSLPRLMGMGNVLSRQGGGGGGGGGARRGAGESKLEYDRRHIRRRIDALRKKLKELELRREQTRKSRKKNDVPVIALVGYTNVGKSTLLNTICGADVLQADMLFATLDATARRFKLPSGPEAIAVDTVGFVSRLPHNLVQAFKSTLEEAAYADIIVKVCDAHDENNDTQLEVTNEVLKELGCDDIPQITVYNKCDIDGTAIPFDTSAICTSAKTRAGIDTLLNKIDEILSERIRKICFLLPYDKLALANAIRQSGTVTKEEYKESGVYFEGIVRTQDLHIYTPFLSPECD